MKFPVDHVTRSIAKAWKHESQLPPETLEIVGRTSPKIRHLLNNLCSLPNTVYLEAGSWFGASFISALAGNENTVKAAVAIDNWCARGGVPAAGYSECERMFDAHRTQFLAAYGDRQIKINQDLSTVDSLPVTPTVFYYDADHGRTREGVLQFFPILADPCIVCLDDWSFPHVRSGWMQAISESEWVIVKEWDMPTKRPKDTDLWWEGFYVAVITRGQADE